MGKSSNYDDIKALSASFPQIDMDSLLAVLEVYDGSVQDAYEHLQALDMHPVAVPVQSRSASDSNEEEEFTLLSAGDDSAPVVQEEAKEKQTETETEEKEEEEGRQNERNSNHQTASEEPPVQSAHPQTHPAHAKGAPSPPAAAAAAASQTTCEGNFTASMNELEQDISNLLDMPLGQVFGKMGQAVTDVSVSVTDGLAQTLQGVGQAAERIWYHTLGDGPNQQVPPPQQRAQRPHPSQPVEVPHSQAKAQN